MDVSSYSHPCLPTGIVNSRTLSRPAGHKVTTPTSLSIIRDITGEDYAGSEDIPQDQPLASSALRADTRGGLQHQCTLVKGLEEWWSLGTSGGSTCPSLRWPEVARVQWDHGAGQENGECWARDAGLHALPDAGATASRAEPREIPAPPPKPQKLPPGHQPSKKQLGEAEILRGCL